MMRNVLVACLLWLSACWLAPARADDDGLRATLDRHLAAINARDLDTLMSTVTGGEALVTILPSGTVLETRAQYRKLHEDWFADDGWRMVFTVQEVRDFSGFGIARVHYDSQERDAEGRYASRSKALLTLTFVREDGAWRLVHDQNTVIPPKAP